MTFIEQGNESGETGGVEGDGLRGDEALGEGRAAEAAELAGPTATEPFLDEKTRELFAHTGYEHMDHMGG